MILLPHRLGVDSAHNLLLTCYANALLWRQKIIAGFHHPVHEKIQCGRKSVSTLAE